VKSAISRRQKKRSEYAYAVGDLEAKQASYTKALSTPGIVFMLNCFDYSL
jgi:hypothetical protein